MRFGSVLEFVEEASKSAAGFFCRAETSETDPFARILGRRPEDVELVVSFPPWCHLWDYVSDLQSRTIFSDLRVAVPLGRGVVALTGTRFSEVVASLLELGLPLAEKRHFRLFYDGAEKYSAIKPDARTVWVGHEDYVLLPDPRGLLEVAAKSKFLDLSAISERCPFVTRIVDNSPELQFEEVQPRWLAIGKGKRVIAYPIFPKEARAIKENHEYHYSYAFLADLPGVALWFEENPLNHSPRGRKKD